MDDNVTVKLDKILNKSQQEIGQCQFGLGSIQLRWVEAIWKAHNSLNMGDS